MAYTLKNSGIGTAIPTSVANQNYINALYKEAYNRDATAKELSIYTGKTVKDAANLILGQSRSPFAMTTSNILNTGLSTPDVTNNLSSQSSAELAYKTFADTSLRSGNMSSEQLMKQYNEINSAQLKEAQNKLAQTQTELDTLKKNRDTQIENYDTQTYTPAITSASSIYNKQASAFDTSYSEQDYKNLLETKKSITNDIITYSNQMTAELENAPQATLQSVAQGRRTAILNKYTDRITMLNSTLSAIDGNFTLAWDTLSKGADVIKQNIDNRLQFLNTVNSIFMSDITSKENKILSLNTEEKALIENAKSQLLAEKQKLDDNIKYIQELMKNKDLAPIIAKAGVSMNDTPKQVLEKLNKYYKDNPADTEKLTLDQKLKLMDLGLTVDVNGNIIKDVSSSSAEQIAEAIKQVESGGNYNAKGSSGEFGAYQFMPNTWGGYSSEYLKSIGGNTNQSLSMTPSNQDAVAKFKINQWLSQGMSVEQIAAKWNSGSEIGWENKIGTNAKGVTYNVPVYVNKVISALRKNTIASQNKLPVEWQNFLKDKTESAKKTFMGLSVEDQSNVYQLVTGNALIGDLAKGMGGAVYAKKLMSLAGQIEPGFSERTNKSRYTFVQQWNNPNGKSFALRTAINTALGHLAELKMNSDELDNKTMQKYNSIKNMIEKEVGNPAVTNFNLTLTALAGELASAYKNGTAPTDQETEKWYDALSNSFSPAQFSEVFAVSSKLLSSKITSAAQEYKNSMGSYPDQSIVQDYPLQQLKLSGVDTSAIDKVLEMQTNNKSSNTTDPLGLLPDNNLNDPLGILN